MPTWDEVVEQHSDRVFRLAAYRLTGNRPDAEDLTQEVFVRVFRSLDSYTPGTFEGWLHRITTNLFLDGARRKQRIRFDALSDERAARLESAAPAPDTAYADQTFDDDIESALATRPPTSGPRSSCATSRASPTRRSPRSWTPSSAPCARASTGAAPCCAAPSPTVRRSRVANGTPGPRSPTRRRSPGEPPRSRVSALVDGRLPAAEEERLWEHVHSCHPCRDLVEREGWVKTRLATLSFDGGGAPAGLKDSLMCPTPALRPAASRPRRGAVTAAWR